MEIRELQVEVHKNAVEHGWWELQEIQAYNNTMGQEVPVEVQRTFGDLIALCHSELSESLEAFRDKGVEPWYKFFNPVTGEDAPNQKPEGAFVELADCIIRILDIAGYYGVDMEQIIAEKHDYNKSRPYRHGGKKL